MRYYQLAKQTHPDVIAQQAREAAAAAASVGPKVASYNKGVLEEDHAAQAAAPTVVPFLEVQAAYDFLMAEEAAAKGAKTPEGRRAGATQARARTLGEVLCDRLKEEPEAYTELWEEILRDKLQVTDTMIDALLKAARASAAPGGKLDAARASQRIILDGSYYGALTLDLRCSAFVSLLSWCQEDEEELGDLALEVIDHINDEDRAHSPAVMAAIGSIFCSGTRSPY